MLNQKLNIIQPQLFQQMQTQGMTFDPSIDCRNDLVNFYGYTREQVNAMSDGELFSIMDKIKNIRKGYEEVEEQTLINIPCSKCKHPEMIELDFYDFNDCYELKCPKCNHERMIHYTYYDSYFDEY